MLGQTLSSGNRQLFDYVNSTWSHSSDSNIWNHAAHDTLLSINKETLDYIRSIAPTDYIWNWTELFGAALRLVIRKTFNKELLCYISALMPSDYKLELDWTKIVNNTTFT